MPEDKSRIIQWVIDTRPLWPVAEDAKPKEQMQEFQQVATKALSFLMPEERKAVLRYYQPKDAKMSLASHLLKYYAVTKLCEVPWSAVRIQRDGNGKPCYIPPPPSGPGAETGGSRGRKRIEFNVSHQAGLVVLIAHTYAPAADGAQGNKLDLGTDVVCVNERDDFKRIDVEGFFAWVDMHSDVFSPHETQAVKKGSAEEIPLVSALFSPMPDPNTTVRGAPRIPRDELVTYARDQIARCQYRNQDLDIEWMPDEEEEEKEGRPAHERRRSVKVQGKAVIEAKLRRFYALWCLREAYVKMTGEALLAPWLRELEFRRFQTPTAASGAALDSDDLADGGQVVTQFEIWLQGRRVRDVRMELRAWGADFMVASVARKTRGVGGDVATNTTAAAAEIAFGDFVRVDLERDVYPMAK